MLDGSVIGSVICRFMDNSMLRVNNNDTIIIPIVPALFFVFASLFVFFGGFVVCGTGCTVSSGCACLKAFV